MNLFEKGELKLLWPFYLDSLLSPLLFFMPAFIIIYFQNLGISLFQLGILMAVSHLASLIFEVPTGALADIFGRKFSVLLGTLLLGIAFLSLFFVTSFVGVLLIFAFIGFSFTLPSGAKEAWTTDLIGK